MRTVRVKQVGRRIQRVSMRMALVLLLVALQSRSVFAVPGGGGPTGPGDPPGFDPCNPPQLPPGLLLPSYAQGRLRETCNGVLRPIANKPIQIIFHTQYQAPGCNGSPTPPAVFIDTPMPGTYSTDANGEFNIEFDTGADPNALFVKRKVRIIVYDDSLTIPIWQTAYYAEQPGQNYDIYEDITAACPTQGTRIRIVSPNGQGSFNAELFINGQLHPVRSNPSGFITIDPPLSPGDKIVARAMVHESKSERGAHSQGSNQNWKYRAYITSLPLQYDSNGDNTSYAPKQVVDPDGAYELRLTRDASYIGLHLVASIEWDATPAELGNFSDKMRKASKFLFNATDGQMLIERIDVLDGGRKWDEADFRVYADASLRANVDWPVGGFWRSHDASFWRSSWMHMSRINSSLTYIHEFGHYGMELKDEYKDNDAGTRCAHGIGTGHPQFESGKSKASCMMFNQFNHSKICSDHPANPHRTGTRQEDEDCWSEIKRHFTAEAIGPNGAPRWFIRTPVDRGVIVDAISDIPVDDWKVLVALDDANNIQLCEPRLFQFTSIPSATASARIFSRSGNRTIIQGSTNALGEITEHFGAIEHEIVGLHVGDEIGAIWWQYSAGSHGQHQTSRVFTDADCTSPFVVLSSIPGQEPTEPEPIVVEGEALPFVLMAQVDPGATIGEGLVRVRAEAALAEAPVVRLSVGNETDARDVAMALEPASGEWVGVVGGLPDQFSAVLDVLATNEEGNTSEFIAHVGFNGAVPDEEAEIHSVNGSIEIEIPVGAVQAPTQIVIGGSVAPLPDDFAGRLITGPISISTGGAQLLIPATIEFGLPVGEDRKLQIEVEPSLLIVIAYDESTGLWNELPARLQDGAIAIETEIEQFGTFALLERGILPSTNIGGSSTNADGTNNTDSGATIDDVASSADCGTGTCGGGTAFASPLMLALFGARRRIRRSQKKMIKRRMIRRITLTS